jgi:protocatechuate 3,4-dioxygenase beta subunit
LFTLVFVPIRYIKLIIPFLFAGISLTSCVNENPDQHTAAASATGDTARDKTVGGPCDRCDVIYEGMPPAGKLSSEISLAPGTEPGDKLLLHGVVLLKDGKTAAGNRILYFYHTNAAGYYAPAPGQTAGRINGHLRGWIKTDNEGRFTIHTIRPAPYPGRSIPAHIHILVKEPGKTRYYLDEVWFDDDPLVTKDLRARAEKRGGDLIIHLAKLKDGSWEATLPITLGLNIPAYD